MRDNLDHYEVLRVDSSASFSEIRRAFHKLAKQFHPDLNQGSQHAEEYFKRINESYSVLSNPEQRRRHDLERARKRLWQGTDYISSIFRRKPSTYRRSPQKGQDILHVLHLNLSDILEGSIIKVAYERQVLCSDCHGQGYISPIQFEICKACDGEGQRKSKGALPFNRTCERCDGRGEIPSKACQSCRGQGLIAQRNSLEVNIPPRLYSCDRLTVKAEGGHGRFGGAPGDLFLEIIVPDSAALSKKGDDLYVEHAAKISDLIFGANVVLPNMGRDIRTRIPPLSSPNTILRIKGEGFLNLDKGVRGDLYISLCLKIPKRLSQDELLLLRKIAESNHEF